jgi:predicted PurR-regulated permease PerM
MMTRQKIQRAARAVLYVALVLLALWVVREFVPAVAWACVIAIVLWPAYEKLERQRGWRGHTTVIALLLTILIALLVVLPIALAVVQAAHEEHEVLRWLHNTAQSGMPAPEFIARLPFGRHALADWWQTTMAQPLAASPAMQGLHANQMVSLGRHFGARVVHGVMLFGFMLVTLFVIFQAGPRLAGSLMQTAQRVFGRDGAQLLQRMASAVRSTVTGLVIVGLSEGALLGVAYLVAGVPHAALLGTATAIAAMVPFCAPLIFCAAALWLLMQGMPAEAAGLAAWGFVVVFIAEHFVRPWLIGNSTRLPFLLVLFGILGGATTFGLLGIFIGPALMTVLMVLWTDWVK